MRQKTRRNYNNETLLKVKLLHELIGEVIS